MNLPVLSGHKSPGIDGNRRIIIGAVLFFPMEPPKINILVFLEPNFLKADT
jgi:hypothetical protein